MYVPIKLLKTEVSSRVKPVSLLQKRSSIENQSWTPALVSSNGFVPDVCLSLTYAVCKVARSYVWLMSGPTVKTDKQSANRSR